MGQLKQLLCEAMEAMGPEYDLDGARLWPYPPDAKLPIIRRIGPNRVLVVRKRRPEPQSQLEAKRRRVVLAPKCSGCNCRVRHSPDVCAIEQALYYR